MWTTVKTKFSKQHERISIVKKMVECGVRVGVEGRLYVGDVALSDTAIASSVDVDRRVVRQVVNQILENKELRTIFTRIKPVGSSLVDVAEELGYSVLLISADPHKPGVVAGVTHILAEHNIIVRQVLADDPDLVPDPKLTLVTEKSIPPEAYDRIRKLPVVKSLTILR